MLWSLEVHTEAINNSPESESFYIFSLFSKLHELIIEKNSIQKKLRGYNKQIPGVTTIKHFDVFYSNLFSHRIEILL